MLKGIKILIVEDSSTQAEQQKYLLEKYGYQVSVTHSGEEALKYLDIEEPAIIISDIMMPEMDGYQLCSRIKSDKRLKDIPVILLTVLSDLADIVKGLQCGADNFITKPFDEHFLHQRIQSIIINRKLRNQAASDKHMSFFFAGQKHSVKLDNWQILNFLLSAFENAVQKNHELIKTQYDLKILNEDLGKMVEERTSTLRIEIEERRKAEHKIEFANAELVRIFESVDEGICLIDNDFNILRYNEKFSIIEGLRKDEEIGKKCYKVFNEPGCHTSECSLTRIINGEEIVETEIEKCFKDGSVGSFIVTGSPFRTAYGEILGIVLTLKNITERKLVEKELLIRDRRIQEELRLANIIQTSLFPEKFPLIPGIMMAASSMAANEVGGDYCDLLAIKDKKLGIAIGDVMGKGVPAALFVAMTYAFVRNHAIEMKSPALLINQVNISLFSQLASSQQFLTLLYCIYDPATRELTYTNAGHNPPIIYRAKSGECETLSVKNFYIGARREVHFKEGKIIFEPGDIMLLYTDGLKEGRNRVKEQFGLERLYNLLKENSISEPDVIQANILDEFNQFIGGEPLYDDVTILILKVMDT